MQSNNKPRDVNTTMTPPRSYYVLLSVLLALAFGCMVMRPLPQAAESKDSLLVQELIRKGTPVDQRGGSLDETALIIAARHGHLGMVKTLLEAGADVHARTREGNTALSAATYSCHSDVALFLVERGADVNAKNRYGSTPLMFAAKCNDLKSLNALIKNKANVNDTDKRGATALIHAAIEGHLGPAESLLTAGADVHHAGTKVEAALFEAAARGHKAIVRLLLEKGADVNYRTLIGDWTPLMIAVRMRSGSTAALLIQAGAKVNLTNEKGQTALIYAASFGDLPTAELLLKNGADPNVVPNGKSALTALMNAAENGQAAIVQLLLRYGADPNLRNKNNHTALYYAKEHTKQLLVAAGGTL